MIRTLTKRPIGVLSATFLLLILGGLALSKLPVGLMPAAKRPVLIIEFDAAGKSALESEETVVTPLRNTLRQIGLLEDFRTHTFAGGGKIILTFSWSANLEDLYLQVNEAIDRSRPMLPPDLRRPTVHPPGAGEIPVAQISISSTVLSLAELSEWATYEGARRMEQLDAIARCEVIGRQESGFAFYPDPQAIEGAGLTLTAVCQQIREATDFHLHFLGGQGTYDSQVDIRTGIHSLTDLRQLPVQSDEGQPILLGDLGTLQETSLPMRDQVMDGQQDAILLRLYERGGASLLDLRDDLDQTIRQMVREHPGLTFRVVDNQSRWVLWSLSGLGQSVMYGAAFAIILLFLVMRSWRAPLLMAITVPSALLLSGLVFYALDLSLNLMSITGLALGVGVLVDNGIIVVENIQRYRQAGLPGGLAVVKGSREMVGPLLASSATTLSMFAPLWLASGITGVLFRDMALAVAISLFTSLLIALLLIPVLDKILPARQVGPNTGAETATPAKPTSISGFRQNLLATGALTLLAGIVLFSTNQMPVSVFPKLPLDETTLHIIWEPGTSLQENLRRTRELITSFPKPFPNLLCLAGPSSQLLAPGSQEDLLLRFTAPQEDLERLPALLSAWMARQAPDASWEISSPPNTLTQWTGALNHAPELSLVPLEAGRMDSLHDLQPLFAAMEQHPSVAEVQLPWSATRPEWRLFPRPVISSGVDPGMLVADWSLYQGQQVLSRWQETDRQHSLILPGSGLPFHHALQHQTLQGIALSELVEAHISMAPAYRIGDDARAFHLVRLQLSDGQTLPEDALATWQDMALAAGWLLLPDPALQESKEQQRELLGLFGIGILLLTVILIAQFESFRLPLVVLSTIPFGIGGSLLLLLLTGAGLNLMSGMGIITVSGIVVNDAILKVETIRRNREAGMAMPEAIRQAGQQRFRAIFLTSATTILAMLPVLFTDGPGGAMQTPLALAVIGGMVAGTLAAIWWVGWLMEKVG